MLALLDISVILQPLRRVVVVPQVGIDPTLRYAPGLQPGSSATRSEACPELR